jgi:hypothetical protein
MTDDSESAGEAEALPVLSLYQPWASLVALGIKTIETRSWPAPKTVIGRRIAIHAAKRNPVKLSWHPDGMIGRYTVHQDGRGEPCYLLDSDWRKFGNAQYPIDLPLGCIVATARLVASVPITDSAVQGEPTISLHAGQMGYGPTLWRDDGHACWSISDQIPYGDFTPGRWAWLFDGIEQVDPPVPFVGGQGFSRRWVRP